MIEKEKRFTLELKSNSSLNTRKENFGKFQEPIRQA